VIGLISTNPLAKVKKTVPIEVVTMLKGWPEFMLEPPSQTLINHLTQVCDATDGVGHKRYSDKTQTKLITSVASFGYGPSFYEAMHLIGLLARLDLPLTALFSRDGQSSSSFLKSVLREQNLLDDVTFNDRQVIISYPNNTSKFTLHFTRISTLEAMIEFIFETIGPEFLFRAWRTLRDKGLDKTDLDKMTNELSASMYQYLQNHLPAAALRAKAKLLSKYLSDHANRNQFYYTDITDELILSFWKEKSADKALRFKLFSSCVHSWIRYRQALRLASHSGFQPMASLNQIVDNSDIDILEFTKVENNYADLIDDQLSLNDRLNILNEESLQTVKFVTKKELKFLELFCTSDKESEDLCLSLLRTHVFSPVQSKLVEVSRKSKDSSTEESNAKTVVSDYIYSDTIKALEAAGEQAHELAKVGCLRLWEDKSAEAITLMMELISEQEKGDIRDQISALSSEIKEPIDIDRRAAKIASMLLVSEEKTLMLIKRDFMAAGRKFKRFGLGKPDKNIADEARLRWHNDLVNGAETQIELHKHLRKLCAKLYSHFPDNAVLASQVRQDKAVFSKQFDLLHGEANI